MPGVHGTAPAQGPHAHRMTQGQGPGGRREPLPQALRDPHPIRLLCLVLCGPASASPRPQIPFLPVRMLFPRCSSPSPPAKQCHLQEALRGAASPTAFSGCVLSACAAPFPLTRGPGSSSKVTPGLGEHGLQGRVWGGLDSVRAGERPAPRKGSRRGPCTCRGFEELTHSAPHQWGALGRDGRRGVWGPSW